ncbi:MAG: ankyrin repeat domain-containing protein [Kiritimatiellae bacterium]|nr:ankyrin repeat domain-containing protein [Kiritimatiellia bacterium]
MIKSIWMCMVGAVLLVGCRREVTESVTVPIEASSTRTDQQAVLSEPAAPSAEFYMAALEGKIDVVGTVVKSGADVNARNEDGHTALMLASFNGHADVVALLLDSGADVRLRDGAGRTALMFASTGPSVPTVKLLLEKKSGVNEVDSGEHWTPLMFAAAEGHADVVKVLLAAGADVNMQDVDGETAGYFARQRGHVELAKMLESEK